MNRRLASGLAAQVVLWSNLALVGSLVLLFAQIFGWVFIPMSDLPSVTAFRGELVHGTGRVVSVEPTSTVVSGRRVMKVEFEHDGAARTATSYTTDLRGLRPGAQAPVEHPA